MKLRPLLQTVVLLVAAMSFTACDSAAESACKRAQECGLFESDETVEACVKDVEEDLAPGQLEECAQCLEDHSCSEIRDEDACEKACDD